MRNVLEEMNQAVVHLRDKGIRMTPQRHEVIRLLIELSHPTPEQLYHEFLKKYPSVSIATIYNNLKALKDLGLVQELSFGDRSSRFEWATEPHYHFTCTKCAEIVDMLEPELHTLITNHLANHPAQVISAHRLELYGLCANCQ